VSGAATDPLPRLAAQFATAVADGSERYDTPGFRVHIWPTPDPFYRNVAIPVDAACTAPDAVAAMLAVFAAHDRLPTVEYFAELWPDLAPALAAQGLALASRGQVMVLAAAPPGPGPGPGPRSPARLLAPGDPAAAIADFLLGAAEVFGQTTVLAPGEALRFAAGLRRGTLAAAMVRRGRLAVAGASLIGAGAVAELAGVWTLPAFQRQGHARACCRLLLERFFGGGGELAWLSVGEPAAAALYAGLGFGTCGTQLNFADAGPA
jgi:ribosomal protein S18 acetylase RimI-like enzyme